MNRRTATLSIAVVSVIFALIALLLLRRLPDLGVADVIGAPVDSGFHYFVDPGHPPYRIRDYVCPSSSAKSVNDALRLKFTAARGWTETQVSTSTHWENARLRSHVNVNGKAYFGLDGCEVSEQTDMGYLDYFIGRIRGR